MKFDGFIGSSYQALSATLDSQRCINLYPELDPTGKNVIALFGRPGKSLFGTVGTGPIRGGIAYGSGLYVVSGTSLYSVDSSGNGTLLGTIAGTDRIDIDVNATQAFISAGSAGYILTLATNVLTAIADPDFPGSVQGKFIDDYIAFVPGNNGRFYITALNDASSIDPLDFASAEGAPDTTIGIQVNRREVWLFGTASTEVWWNSGASDFPFERVSGGFIEHGCASADTITKIDDTLFWLAANKSGGGYVVKSEGYAVARISSPAVENAIASYSTIQDATAYTYTFNEHLFYVLNFPAGGTSWVYDAKTGFWFEQQYRNTTTAAAECDRGTVSMVLNDGSKYKTIVGDRTNGNLYLLDNGTYTDNGDPVLRLRASRHIFSERHRITHSKFQVEFEPGVGIATGQGSDPQAIMRYSDDGGFTWRTERWADIGAQGSYGIVAKWRRLGISRDRVYEVSVTDPVKVVMVDASIEIQEHGE